jgi:hypothetical protein
VLVFSRELPATDVGAVVLAADLRIGGVDGFAHVADVAGFDDGRFAVLDRMNEQITVHARDGKVIHRMGQAGRGPGEFAGPIVLARVSDRLVVWDRAPDRTFTVFDTAGQFLQSAPMPTIGDWRSHMIRSNWVFTDDYGSWTEPAEDLTRRLLAFGPDHFLHVLQLDEQAAMFEKRPFPDDRPAFLIRYDLTGQIIDTLGVLSAAPSYFVDWKTDARYPSFAEPQLVGRPLVATGSTWWAAGHGDSTSVRIHFNDGSYRVIRLAGVSRPLTNVDRTAWTDRVVEIALQAYRGNRALPRTRMTEYRQALLEQVRFPETAPRLTGLYGTGQCLWLSAFNPRDHVSGGSLTWTVVNVSTNGVQVVRVPRALARVRDIDRYGVFTTFRDDLGVFYLERWPVTHTGC